MPKPPEEDLFLLPDEYKFIARNKRAVFPKNRDLQRLNVETLVVVDRKMMDNHGHDNITTYALTVLNMVREMLTALLQCVWFSVSLMLGCKYCHLVVSRTGEQVY